MTSRVTATMTSRPLLRERRRRCARRSLRRYRRRRLGGAAYNQEAYRASLLAAQQKRQDQAAINNKKRRMDSEGSYAFRFFVSPSHPPLELGADRVRSAGSTDLWKNRWD